MIKPALAKRAIVTGALGLWLLAVSALAQTTAMQQTNAAKDLAIMSRILEKRLGDDLKEDVITASLFQRGIQGFYVRGIGAMFFIDVRFPVAQPPVEKPTTGTKRPDDLWSRFEQEMETPSVGYGAPDMPMSLPGTPDPFFAPEPTSGRAPFSKAKVERLTAGLLDVLAQYGRRIGALSNDERIVIVVSGSGERSPLASSLARERADYLRAADSYAAALRMEAESRATAGAAVEPSPPTSVVQNFEVKGRWTAGSVLTLSVTRKDLADDPKELAKRATIRAYTY